MRRTFLFVALLLSQVFILASMGILWVLTDTWGREIQLQAEVVDPTDFFYGDYLEVRYPANRVPISLWKSDTATLENILNKPVYVAFTPAKNKIWDVRGVYPNAPHCSSKQIVLKAQLANISQLEGVEKEKMMDLFYGMEYYYFSQKNPPNVNQNESIIVGLKVAPWGQTRIIKMTNK